MGEALWDMLPEGKKIGGAPANFAYHISQNNGKKRGRPSPLSPTTSRNSE